MNAPLWTTTFADRQILPPFLPPSTPSNATDRPDQSSNHSSVIYVVSFSGTVAVLLFTACLLIWRASSRERRAERLVRRAGRERRDDWEVVAAEIRQAGLDVPASVRERIERKKRERNVPRLWEVEVGKEGTLEEEVIVSAFPILPSFDLSLPRKTLNCSGGLLQPLFLSVAPFKTALLSPAVQPSAGSTELALHASSTRTTTTSRRPLLGFLGRSSSSAYTADEDDASSALEHASAASLREEAFGGEAEMASPEASFEVRVGVLVLMPGADEGREDVGGSGMDVGSELCVVRV